MSTLTGRKPKDTYKDLLQVSNGNTGIDATLRPVEDGEGTQSPLQVSSDAVNIQSGFRLGGVAVTATADQLNSAAGVTQYTDEMAQDAVGGILTDTATIDLTYDDAGNTITADVKADSLSAGYLHASATDVVFGRFSAGAGAGQEIACTAFGRSLIDDADAATARNTLGLGTLATQNGTFSGTSSGINTGDQTDISGNAGTATKLATARNINGTSFDGSADITVTAAAGTLTGTTLASGVTASSLTSLGTLTGLTLAGNLTFTTAAGRAITGDMSNATVTSRTYVQSSTTNGATVFSVLPNGTDTQAYADFYGTSSTTNAPYARFGTDGTNTRINSLALGSGTAGPILFQIASTNYLQILNGSNLGTVFIGGAASNVVPSMIQGAASQTADLTNWRDSTGTVLAKITAAGALQSAGATLVGDLTFSTAAGRKITGDMANATVTSRTYFQGSTTNASTIVTVVPNGTGTAAYVECYGGSSPSAANNTVYSRFAHLSGNTRIENLALGSGTTGSIVFAIGGTQYASVLNTGSSTTGTFYVNGYTAGSFGILVRAQASPSNDQIQFQDSTAAIRLGVNSNWRIRGAMQSPTQITADQNNWTPSAVGRWLRVSSDAARTITGMTQGVDGEESFILNVGSFNITLSHQSGSSTAANRWLCNTGTDVVIAPDDGVGIVYDATTARWRVFA